MEYRPPNATLEHWFDMIELFMRDPEAWSSGNSSKGMDELDECTKFILDFPDILDDNDGGELVILGG